MKRVVVLMRILVRKYKKRTNIKETITFFTEISKKVSFLVRILVRKRKKHKKVKKHNYVLYEKL